MTLTSDFLILNMCSKADVMCSNSVPNLSKIHQRTVALLTIQQVWNPGFRRFCFFNTDPTNSKGVDRTNQIWGDKVFLCTAMYLWYRNLEIALEISWWWWRWRWWWELR